MNKRSGEEGHLYICEKPAMRGLPDKDLAPYASSQPNPAVWLSVGFVLLIGVHLWFARNIPGPIVTPDETGYLGNASFLAGFRPADEMLAGPVYAWGYSLLLAPIAWIVRNNPAALFQGAQVLNAFLMAAVLPLAWLLLHRVLGFGSKPSLQGAVISALYPSILVTSGSAWSENLLIPLTIWWAITVWLTLDEQERPIWQRLAIVPTTLFLHAAHPRYLVVLVLCIVGFVVAAGFGWVTKRVATLGIAGLLLGWFGSRLISAWVVAARWPDKNADEGTSKELIHRLITPSYLPKTGAGMVGQGWYLTIGSLGLATVGGLAILWLILHRETPLSSRRRLTLTTIFIGLSALFTTSVLSFVTNNPRTDTLIYGRYNESFVPILVAIGIATLFAIKSAQRTLLIATIICSIFLNVALIAARGTNLFKGEIVWNMVLSLYPHFWLFGSQVIVIGAVLLSIAVLISLYILITHGAYTLASSLIIVLFIAFGLLTVQPLEHFTASVYNNWHFIPELERAVDTTQVKVIGVDSFELSHQAEYSYGYWIPKVVLSKRIRGPEAAYDVDLAIAKPDVVPFHNEQADEWVDSAVVALDGLNNQAVWVRPGPIYEQLAQEGALLPKGWMTERPLDNMMAEISVISSFGSGSSPAWAGEPTVVAPIDCSQPARGESPPQIIEVTSGGWVGLCVQVTNSDTHFAWPADSTWPAPGVIRMGLRWLSSQTYTEGSSALLFEAPYRVPIPHYMWAGDSEVLPVAIYAINDHGEPLPPGEYVLGLEMLQEGFRWFSEPGQEPLRLSVIVRPAE
ncbi:MAG: hypothetical protein WC184_08410 [Acidimicrobiia bacterium]